MRMLALHSKGGWSLGEGPSPRAPWTSYLLNSTNEKLRFYTFLGLVAEAPILWPPDAKRQVIGKARVACCITRCVTSGSQPVLLVYLVREPWRGLSSQSSSLPCLLEFSALFSWSLSFIHSPNVFILYAECCVRHRIYRMNMAFSMPWQSPVRERDQWRITVWPSIDHIKRSPSV